jgi:two-component system LytT family response regulator
MNAFLVDDESNCTDVLQVFLGRYCPEIQVTGIFNDPVEALSAIQARRPDILFLDIEMPVLNGFDLLKQCPVLDFKLIFTTAYDRYAVKAFKFNALDYLLKPIDRDELIAAVAKAKQSRAPEPEKLEVVSYLRQHPVPERIALPVGAELIIVATADILYCESDGSYVSFYLLHQPRPVIVSKSLREIEELLNNPGFFRPHNSFLIQMKFISKIIRTDGGEVVMTNGKSIPVARNKKAELLSRMTKL